MNWLDLEARFRAMTERLRYVRLDIQTGDAGEHFRLAGGLDPQARLDFETVSKLAGRKILEVGGVSDSRVNSEADHLIRWYKALSLLSGLARSGLVAQQLDDSGEPSGFIFTASIDRIAEASAALCLQFFAEYESVGPSPREALGREGLGQDESPEEAPDPRKVFVVHGRDLRVRDDLFDLLRSVDLEPMEWEEAIRLTRQGSPYIGTILETALDNAQAIVVLLTPDDEVRLRGDLASETDPPMERNTALQARPNVLFEAGMALARDPDRTILVEVGPVKPFSDVAGRHVVRLTDSEKRRRDLLERLETAGCALVMEGDEWKSVGSFYPSDLKATQGLSVPDSEPTVRWVDLEYPSDSGLQERLESEGFSVRWSRQDRLARRLAKEGWSLAVEEDQKGQRHVLKSEGGDTELTLIKRRAFRMKVIPNPRMIRGRPEKDLRVLRTATQVVERELVEHLQRADGLEGRIFLVETTGDLASVVLLPSGVEGTSEERLEFQFDVQNPFAEARRIADEVIRKYVAPTDSS